ncbi:MAG: hypothetical protein OXG49_17770, partial [Chloroflexi bacterium]|nr:hypothetical protein [Chloroflexota bacterium]
HTPFRLGASRDVERAGAARQRLRILQAPTAVKLADDLPNILLCYRHFLGFAGCIGNLIA